MFGPLLIIVAAVLWALDGLLRRNLYSLPPLTVVFSEHAIGLLFLLPVVWSSRQIISKLAPKEWGMVSLVSLLSGLVGTVLFTAALQQANYLPLSIVFLLQKLQPIFVFATATLILKERVKSTQLAWSLLALIAGFFMTFPTGQVVLAGNTTMAALMALGAAAAWGTSTVFSRWLLLRLPANTATALRFLLTTIIGAIAMLAFPTQQALASIQVPQLLNLVVIAFSTGMVALTIYYHGLKRTNATTATILELFFPVLAVVIDSYLYKTSLSPVQYLSAATLLVSAWQIARHNQQLLKTSFTAHQVKGDGRGKKMGFPTINLTIPSDLDLAHGIYATKVTIGKHTHTGALHFGPIPTFNKETVTLEVFLLDTKEVPKDLATKKTTITVEVTARLREVLSFKDRESLVAQIAKDVSEVKTIN